MELINNLYNFINYNNDDVCINSYDELVTMKDR